MKPTNSNSTHLDDIFNKLKAEQTDSLPAAIRDRMEQTYQSLGDIVQQEASHSHSQLNTKSRKRVRLLTAAAAIIVIFLGVIGSGFVSPVMANALRQIPAFDSVFKLAGDLGLRAADEKGLKMVVNQQVTQGGISLGISELIYDGSRLSFILSDMTPGKEKQNLFDKWSARPQNNIINQIEYFINGEQVNTGQTMAGVEQVPNAVIIGALNTTDIHPPDQFDLTIRIHYGGVDAPFEFQIPVTKSTNTKILISAGKRNYDQMELQVDRIMLSPITTRVEVKLMSPTKLDLKSFMSSIPDRYKIAGSLNLQFDIMNESGQIPGSVGASGESEASGTISLTTLFEPFEAMPKTITVKPYIRMDEKKLYVPELEITVPVE